MNVLCRRSTIINRTVKDVEFGDEANVYLQCVGKQNNEVLQIQHQIRVVAVGLKKQKIVSISRFMEPQELDQSHNANFNPAPRFTLFLRGGS